MVTKISIIGSGFGLYGLLPAFNQIKGCKVKSICGKNSQRMIDYCKKMNIKKYDNWKEMLEKEKPDAVAIAVIPKHQFKIAKFSLENNIAVFAEKPLTTSITTAKKLTTLAKKKKIPNMVNFIFADIPEWSTTKKILDKNTIGKIIKINVTWTFLSYDLKNQIKSWKTDVRLGGGALSFYFSHVLYYLEYFLGPIKIIQSKLILSNKSISEGETGIEMTISFENKGIGKIFLDISSTKKQHKIEFLGKEGSLILQNNSNKVVDDFELICKKSNKTNKIRVKKSSNFFNNPDDDPRVKIVTLIAERFIKWCETGIESKPTFQDGLRVQELIKIIKLNSKKVII